MKPSITCDSDGSALYFFDRGPANSNDILAASPEAKSSHRLGEEFVLAAIPRRRHNGVVARDAAAPARTASADWLPVVVERLVQQFQPLRIILFGSHARGDARPDSDLDLLVVLPHLEDKRRTMVEMLRTLSDLPVGTDVIPTDPDEIERRRNIIGTVLRPALREGRVLYERIA